MAIPLRLLILEDNPSDAELALHALQGAGFAPVADQAETEHDFRKFLRADPEIILADFSMPEFDALRALEILQESGLDIPVIIVSGTIGEERAVQIMQRGATDYIIKDRLGRLGQAVVRALEERLRRKEKRLAECRLHAQHATTRVLAESASPHTAIPQVIEAVCQNMGWAWAGVWTAVPHSRRLKLAHVWHAGAPALALNQAYVSGRFWTVG